MSNILIIGHGGIKGYMELGALYYLETKDKLKIIDTYVGVSIGSVISLLLIAGYKIMEILSEFLSVNFTKDEFSFNSLVKKFGLVSIKKIKIKLKELIIKKW